MKPITQLLLCAALTLTSCRSDEPFAEQDHQPSELAGSWIKPENTLPPVNLAITRTEGSVVKATLRLSGVSMDGTVASRPDGLTLALDDGRVVRLRLVHRDTLLFGGADSFTGEMRLVRAPN